MGWRFRDWKNLKGQWPQALPLLIFLMWTCLVAVSLFFNVRHSYNLEHDMALSQAEAVVEYNKIARLWNARHGGPYVPVDETTQPNPYLRGEYRDFVSPHGIEMTQVNPAYMSRQMSELAAERGGLTFRLTSLELTNPKNAPSDLERDILEGFERGEPAYHTILTNSEGRRLFFMDEFRVEPACLNCHDDRGYVVGDVRGGISVEIPLEEGPDISEPIMTHIALLLGGGLLMGFAAGRSRDTFNQLTNNAAVDELTGLPNRRTLVKQMDAEFKAARRHDFPLSFLVIDIDEFKSFNDHFGHLAGDLCLKRIAGILEATLRRAGDKVGRYGGEEFVVILPHTSLREAAQVAELLRQAVEEARITAPPGAQSPVVTISIGIAEQQSEDLSFNMLFDRADNGMYDAKRQGRNQVAFANGAERRTV